MYHIGDFKMDEKTKTQIRKAFDEYYTPVNSYRNHPDYVADHMVGYIDALNHLGLVSDREVKQAEDDLYTWLISVEKEVF